MENLIKNELKKIIMKKIMDKSGINISTITAKLADLGLPYDEDTLKISWNYSEKNTKNYSFTELLDWVKLNLPEHIKKACIYKTIDESKKHIQLHICFLDGNDEPLLDGDFPHQIVKTISLDKKLQDGFGNKDILILG